MSDFRFSDRFPTKDEVVRAAANALKVERDMAVLGRADPAMIAIVQRDWQVYQSLPPHERQILQQVFNNAKQDVLAHERWSNEVATAEAIADQSDAWMKDTTKSLGVRPGGLTVEQFVELKDTGTVKVPLRRKVPDAKESDRRVREHTARFTKDGKGYTLAQYEERLLHLREMGRSHPQYDKTREKYFPGAPAKDIDKLVRNALHDAVGLEMIRRAEKDQPKYEKLSVHDRDLTRLDLIESIAEVGDRDPEGTGKSLGWTADEFVQKVAREEGDHLRGAVAQAVMQHGGLSNVDFGGGGEIDRTTDEVAGDEDAR